MRLFLSFLLFFFSLNSYALSSAQRKAIGLEEALEIHHGHPHSEIRLGVHDVSFYGRHLVLADLLHSRVNEPAYSLQSPHGASVTQIIVDPVYGVNPDLKVSSLTSGIFEEDFEKAIEIWRDQGIRLINLSMGFRSPRIVEILNDFIDEGGIVISSSGNSRLRLGEEPKPWYKDFKGILVGASNLNGEMTDFSQYLDGKTILAPGEIESLTVERVFWTGVVRGEPTSEGEKIRVGEYHFGMTSGAAPIVTGVVSLALQINPSLTQQDINRLLIETSRMVDGKPFLQADRFLEAIIP